MSRAEGCLSLELACFEHVTECKNQCDFQLCSVNVPPNTLRKILKDFKTK